MKNVALFVAGVICGMGVFLAPRVAAHLHMLLTNGEPSGEARVHTKEKFAFVANGPMEVVAPLFGAEKERVWAPGWEPKFVYPLPAADKQGMVFEVAHSHLKATWVNTQLDWKNGRVQYVYMIPDAMVAVITLQLTPEGDRTRVDVEYDRTALSAEAEEHVKHMAEGDRRAGPEWEEQVNGYLGKKP